MNNFEPVESSISFFQQTHKEIFTEISKAKYHFYKIQFISIVGIPNILLLALVKSKDCI